MNFKIVCIFGFQKSSFQELLKKNPKEIIALIEDRDEISLDDPLLQDQRIRTFRVNSPLQFNRVAYEIAELSVLWQLDILDESESPNFESFKKELIHAHRDLSGQLSDAADYGCGALLNAKQNISKKVRSLLGLKNVFSQIPAIIVGAGPSLEKVAHLLPDLEKRALIFSGGTALEKIPCKPHFAAAIDPHTPITSQVDLDTIFCLQARTHPQSIASFQGEMLIAPDSHFSFLNELMGIQESFGSGWTVGNFITAIAAYLGCNPIICMGMDYCYEERRKYAFSKKSSNEDLVEAVDRDGKEVWTQGDWLMAVEWMKGLAREYPEQEFYALENRMGYFPNLQLDQLPSKEIEGLQEKVRQGVAKVPYLIPSLLVWKDHLLRAHDKLARGVDIEDEMVFEYLLKPLWKSWKGVFARESLEDLPNHRIVFFDGVIREHLNAIEK